MAVLIGKTFFNIFFLKRIENKGLLQYLEDMFIHCKNSTATWVKFPNFTFA